MRPTDTECREIEHLVRLQMGAPSELVLSPAEANYLTNFATALIRAGYALAKEESSLLRNKPSPDLLALAQAIVDRGPETRTEEQIIADGVTFIMGDGESQSHAPAIAGECFGVTIDERYAPGYKTITLLVEDDGNWFEKQSFDAHWLPDIIAVLQRALSQAQVQQNCICGDGPALPWCPVHASGAQQLVSIEGRPVRVQGTGAEDVAVRSPDKGGAAANEVAGCLSSRPDNPAPSCAVCGGPLPCIPQHD